MDIIVGMGEVGLAVQDLLAKDIIFLDKYLGLDEPFVMDTVEVMHICFPYNVNFVEDVQSYMQDFSPEHVVVWSTVPIGTCKKISHKVVHSPVEGKHPLLAESLKNMVRWLGVNDPAEEVFFLCYFSFMNMRTIIDTNFTEFLKLRSTAKYGINIVWTDYEANVAMELEMPFNLITEFDRDYNDMYESLEMDEYKRYILDPPVGKIGGHCVIPNAQMLNKQFPHQMLTAIEDMQ